VRATGADGAKAAAVPMVARKAMESFMVVLLLEMIVFVLD
jgi:hypothetical protein